MGFQKIRSMQLQTIISYWHERKQNHFREIKDKMFKKVNKQLRKANNGSRVSSYWQCFALIDWLIYLFIHAIIQLWADVLCYCFCGPNWWNLLFKEFLILLIGCYRSEWRNGVVFLPIKQTHLNQSTIFSIFCFFLTLTIMTSQINQFHSSLFPTWTQ